MATLFTLAFLICGAYIDAMDQVRKTILERLRDLPGLRSSPRPPAGKIDAVAIALE
jgi:hypothetical protein